jgi:ribonuclease J
MDINLKKHHSDLLFTPLGGAGEIGMNVNMYHLNGKWLMVDLGLGFAHDIPGVDMLAPDISFARAHKKNIVGLILTHIHEDHLGAVQYLWQELEMPIYTSNFTAKFLRAKLEEFPFASQVKIITIDPTQDLKLDPFTIEFIGLTHSVPEMNALMIKTSHGNVLHSGDWKFDPDPVIGNVSEKEKIKAYGDRGEILALVCDSTNALSPGRSRSEGDLYESLKTIVQDCQHMVGVTTFASNIARVNTIARVAKACGRKVVLAGFSLHRIVEVAKKSGYFEGFDNIISDRELKNYSKNEILVLATGCQGEPMASARKIANDAHPTIRFAQGDTMIFSSKIIPGNEKDIFSLFNDYARKKITVITEKDHFVHVSGHPNQDELREMYDLAKPKIAVPVHGEFVHIQHHSAIAKEMGVQKVITVENGAVVKLSKDVADIVGFVQSGYYGVDGRQLVPINGEIIKTRRKLEHGGIVIVNVVVNSENGEIVGSPVILAPGCYDFRSDPETYDTLKREINFKIRNSLKDAGISKKGLKDKIFSKKQKKNNNLDKIEATLEKTVTTYISKVLNELIGKKPLVEVIIRLI